MTAEFADGISSLSSQSIWTYLERRYLDIADVKRSRSRLNAEAVPWKRELSMASPRQEPKRIISPILITRF